MIDKIPWRSKRMKNDRQKALDNWAARAGPPAPQSQQQNVKKFINNIICLFNYLFSLFLFSSNPIISYLYSYLKHIKKTPNPLGLRILIYLDELFYSAVRGDWSAWTFAGTVTCCASLVDVMRVTT